MITEARKQSLRNAAYSVVRGDRVFIEQVIERAIEEDCSIFHAAHLIAVDNGTARDGCFCTPCLRAAGRLA